MLVALEALDQDVMADLMEEAVAALPEIELLPLGVVHQMLDYIPIAYMLDLL